MTQKMIKLYLVLLLVGLAYIPLVSAVTIDISPNQIAPGGTIVANVHGLVDGAHVTMLVKTVINQPGTSFSYDISGLVFPINLDKARFTIENLNVSSGKLRLVNSPRNLPMDKIEVIRTGDVEDGVWRAIIDEEGLDDINGTYDLISMSGTTSSGTKQVISTMQWEGTKEALEDWYAPRSPQNGGPADFVLQFTLNGIQCGSTDVTITVDGNRVVSKNIYIGDPSCSSVSYSSYSSDSPPGSNVNSQPQGVVLTKHEVPPPTEVPPPKEISSPVVASVPEPEPAKSSAPESPSYLVNTGSDSSPVTPTSEPVLDTLRSTAHNATAMTPASLIFPPGAVPAVAVVTGIGLASLSSFFMANLDKLFSLKLFGFVRDYAGEHALQGVDEYEAKKRKIAIRTGAATILGLTHSEIAVAIIGSILIGVATIIAVRDPFSLTTILMYIIAGGIAVTLHEFGHRFAAKRKNVATEVKFWGLGAVTMFLTGWFTGSVFAQPQRTLIDEKTVEERVNDGEKIPVDVQISLAGPLVNLGIAVITIPFLFVGGWVTQVASIMLMMTLLLAVFHLMPFSPMDGKAIVKWNKYVLAAMLIPLIAVYSYLFLL